MKSSCFIFSVFIVLGLLRPFMSILLVEAEAAYETRLGLAFYHYSRKAATIVNT